MKKQEQTISDLVHAAKHQDQLAFRQLLDLHWNELYGFMIKRTENENDAEDPLDCLDSFKLRTDFQNLTKGVGGSETKPSIELKAELIVYIEF